MSTVLIPEPGSPTAVALALSQKMDADVDLQIVPVPEQPGQYGVRVSSTGDLTRFYEKVLPKRNSGGSFGDDDFFVWDDWTHEREFYETESTPAPEPYEIEVKSKPGLWARIKAWFSSLD